MYFVFFWWLYYIFLWTEWKKLWYKKLHDHGSNSEISWMCIFCIYFNGLYDNNYNTILVRVWKVHVCSYFAVCIYLFFLHFCNINIIIIVICIVDFINNKLTRNTARIISKYHNRWKKMYIFTHFILSTLFTVVNWVYHETILPSSLKTLCWGILHFTMYNILRV